MIIAGHEGAGSDSRGYKCRSSPRDRVAGEWLALTQPAAKDRLAWRWVARGGQLRSRVPARLVRFGLSAHRNIAPRSARRESLTASRANSLANGKIARQRMVRWWSVLHGGLYDRLRRGPSRDGPASDLRTQTIMTHNRFTRPRTAALRGQPFRLRTRRFRVRVVTTHLCPRKEGKGLGAAGTAATTSRIVCRSLFLPRLGPLNGH
jgi:hypothetical protein